MRSGEPSSEAEHLKEKVWTSEARAVCLGCPNSSSLLRLMILGMQACISHCILLHPCYVHRRYLRRMCINVLTSALSNTGSAATARSQRKIRLAGELKDLSILREQVKGRHSLSHWLETCFFDGHFRQLHKLCGLGWVSDSATVKRLLRQAGTWAAHCFCA